MLDNAVNSDGTTSVTSKVALRAGYNGASKGQRFIAPFFFHATHNKQYYTSSQQGNARRASVASNCVVARYL